MGRPTRAWPSRQTPTPSRTRGRRVPSPRRSKSVVTPPLDEFFTAEQFWELNEKMCRAGYTMPTIGKLFGGSVKDHEVNDLPDGSFEVKSHIKGPFFATSDVKLRIHHSFDKEKQEWYSYRYMRHFTDDDLTDDDFWEKTTLKLHQ